MMTCRKKSQFNLSTLTNMSEIEHLKAIISEGKNARAEYNQIEKSFRQAKRTSLYINEYLASSLFTKEDKEIFKESFKTHQEFLLTITPEIEKSRQNMILKGKRIKEAVNDYLQRTFEIDTDECCICSKKRQR